MLRKVIVTTVVIGLSIILILGAVNRTTARLGGSAGQTEAETHESETAPDPAATLTLTGTVTSVDTHSLLVTGAAGEVLIEGRAWRYAREQRFEAAPGELIMLNGFYDPDHGEFEVMQITNQTRGVTLQVRDAAGMPMWGGGGRGAAAD